MGVDVWVRTEKLPEVPATAADWVLCYLTTRGLHFYPEKDLPKVIGKDFSEVAYSEEERQIAFANKLAEITDKQIEEYVTKRDLPPSVVPALIECLKGHRDFWKSLVNARIVHISIET